MFIFAPMVRVLNFSVNLQRKKNTIIILKVKVDFNAVAYSHDDFLIQPLIYFDFF